MLSLSYRAELSIRICVWSTAASLAAAPLSPPLGHASEASSPSISYAMSIGFAFLLSLVFACVWEPFREFCINALKWNRNAHGHPIGLLAFISFVSLGAVLALIHGIMHHYFNHHPEEALSTFVERTSIVLIVCCCWFTPPKRTFIAVCFVVLLIVCILFIGLTVADPWTNSEKLYTMLACAPIALFGQPNAVNANEGKKLGSMILKVASVVLAVAVVLYKVDEMVFYLFEVHVPDLFIYSNNIQDNRDLLSTLVDDIFFYGGWGIGTWVIFSSDDSSEAAH